MNNLLSLQFTQHLMGGGGNNQKDRTLKHRSRRKMRSTILTKQSSKCGSDWRKLPTRSYLS